jgi:hypothetical protein
MSPVSLCPTLEKIVFFFVHFLDTCCIIPTTNPTNLLCSFRAYKLNVLPFCPIQHSPDPIRTMERKIAKIKASLQLTVKSVPFPGIGHEDSCPHHMRVFLRKSLHFVFQATLLPPPSMWSKPKLKQLRKEATRKSKTYGFTNWRQKFTEVIAWLDIIQFLSTKESQ